MAKKQKNKGRKKPPGAKRQGVPARNNLVGNPLAKMLAASEICSLYKEHCLEVMEAIREFLNTTTFEPSVPKGYSIFAGGFGDADFDSEFAVISVYGLDFLWVTVIQDFLERHPKSDKWGVYSSY